MEILALKESAIADDGRHVKLKLETDSTPLDIDINASLLAAILSQLTATVVKAREKQGGRYSPLSAEPAGHIVKAGLGGQYLNLGFRMENGLDYSFRLAVPDATLLRNRLGEELDRLKSS